MTIYTVPGTGYAQLIINAGDGPTMVINRDETNQLYVGDDNSVASKQGTGAIDIIDPLSYIVYNGVTSKYAISSVATPIVVNTVQGGTNWAPSPAQAAFQISQLGLAKDTSVQSTNTVLNSGIALPVGASKDTSVTGISGQPGWPTSGIARETGGNLDTHTKLLNGTTAGALVGVTGNTIGKEIASWIAGGAVGATPGGAAILNSHNQIMNALSQTIAGGGNVTVGSTAINQPGWVMVIAFAHAAGATVPHVDVDFQWIDSGSGRQVFKESWAFTTGLSPNPGTVYLGRGIHAGNDLQAFIVNLDPAAVLTYSVFAYQTSVTPPHTDFRLQNVGGLTIPGSVAFADYSNMAAGIIAQRQNATLAAATQETIEAPPFGGRAYLFGNTTSGLADMALTLNAQGMSGAPSNRAIALINSDSGGHINQQLILPRVPIQVTMRNNNAAAKSCDWMLVAADY